MIQTVQGDGFSIALVEGEGFTTVQEASDLMATVGSVHGCEAMVVSAEHIAPEFFELRTGLAGEILQKYTNYHMRFAVVGDFADVQSRALRDFIYESNKGGNVLFVGTAREAVQRWGGELP